MSIPSPEKTTHPSGLAVVLAAALLAMVLAGPALAEEAGELGDPLLGADEEILFGNIPSVYSASKYEQKVTEAPSAVSVVTADEIERYGYRTLGEILESLPGVYVSYDRNYSYLGVRGFARAGDFNSRVLVLVDGHRLNDPVYEGAPLGHDFPVDVELIERVELVRGPASSLYGTSAFFGVVNVITKDGRDLQAAEAQAGYGNDTTYHGRLSYGHKFDNGVEVLASSSYHQSDGKRRLFFPEYLDPGFDDGVASNGDDEQAYQLFGNFAFRNVTLQVVHASREKGIPTASYETVFDTWRTRTWDDYTWLDLSYREELAGWQLLGRAYWDHYRYYGDYLYDYSETDEPDYVLNQDHTAGDRWGLELSASRRLFDRHRVTLGGEFRDNFRQDQSNSDRFPPWTYLDEEHESDDWGVYLQDEFQILDNLILSAGVRHDHYDSFGGTTNPRVGLIYSPFRSTTLKLLYGEAFRAPSAYELYYNDGGNTTKPAVDLDPEAIETFEFVVEQELGEHFRFQGSLYQYEIEDLVQLRTDPADDLLFFANESDDLKARGMELTLSGSWHRGIEGRLSYALQRAESDATDRRLSNSPKHLARFNLIVPLIEDKLFAGTELQYTSRRKTLAGSNADGFFVANLTLFSHPLPGGLEVSGTVYNLFDEEFSDPGSEEHLQDTLEQNGRTFWLEVGYSF